MRRSRELLVLAGILLAGVVLRVAYLREIAPRPYFRFLDGGAEYNHYWARGLATGDWTAPGFRADPRIPDTPYFHPPGYPCFLSVVFRLTKRPFYAPRTVQLALGILSCALGYLLAQRWFGSITGLVFAGLMATYWSFIHYETEFLEPVILVPLTLLMLYVLGLWVEKPRWPRALGAGVLLGLYALVRPNVLLFVLAVPPWFAWVLRRRSRPWRSAVASSAALLGGALLAIAPATIRNYVVDREVVLICSDTGINLYTGNHPGADGLPGARPAGLESFDGYRGYPALVKALSKESGAALKYAQASRAFTAKAFAFMKERPLEALRLLGRRTLLFWGPVETGHDKEDYFIRTSSRVLRALFLGFPHALTLCVVGALMLGADTRHTADREAAGRQAEFGVLLLLFAATYFVSLLPFFVSSQLRVPILPILLLFSAYAIHRMVRFVLASDFYHVAFWFFVALIVYALASANLARVIPDRARWYSMYGTAWARAGQDEEAAHAFLRSLDLDLEDAEAYHTLGVLLAEQGRPNEAVTFLERAIQIDPQGVEARSSYALILARMGRTDEAVSQLEEALQLSPDHPVLLNNLAWILATRAEGDDEDAARAVALAEKACRLATFPGPSHLDTLAAAYAAAGRFGEAAARAREGAALAESRGMVQPAAEMRRRAELYAAGRACRVTGSGTVPANPAASP